MIQSILFALWFGASAQAGGGAHVQNAPSPARERIAELNAAISVPSDIKARGEHGTVEIEGGLTAEGAIADPKIVRSSRSERIDAIALSVAQQMKPNQALLDKGYARVRVTVSAYNYDMTSLDRGYRCDQAVLDSDWYRRTFATDHVGREPLASMFLIASWSKRPEFKFGGDLARFPKIWWEAVDACRADQGRSFVDMLIELGNSK